MNLKFHKTLSSLFFLALLIAGCGTNYTSKLEAKLGSDSRNDGIVVSLYQDGDNLTFDLKSVSESRSPADVTRVLFNAAAMISEEPDLNFKEVLLCYKGSTRFKMAGSDFIKLGKEYATDQNPVFLIRTLPEKLLTPTGEQAYQTWTGGLLGVANKQMEDFNDFHKKWYIDEPSTD